MKIHKKMIILFCSFLLVFLVFVSILLVMPSKKFVVNDNLLAIKLDGAAIDYFPDYSSGNYTVEINCSNATGTWKPVINRKNGSLKWGLQVNSITDDVACELEFNTMTESDKLINIIKDLETKTNNIGICSDNTSTSQSTCEATDGNWWGVYNENGLRFEGRNPNNYVIFNDQLWRIIGYLPIKGADNSTKSLIKIIKDTGFQLTNYSDSHSREILNNNFLYSKTCKTGRDFCDFSLDGIHSSFRSMIESVQWYTGNGTGAPNERYNAEKASSTNVSGGIKIYSMNLSDYGYAVLKSDCPRTRVVQNYKNLANDCVVSNWLYTKEEKAIGADIASDGGINGYGARYVRPAVHLNENVYVVSGTGTINNPYILDM